MQATIDIFVTNGRKQSFTATKTIELAAIPGKDVEIEDSVWHREVTKKIEAIVLNLKDNGLYISLEPDSVVNIEQSKQIYESHGWKIVSYKTC